ncbi:MAG: glycosyltransferase family 4 protein [Anaerolineae bacterium]|jgi:glycosyltransferase involved in cell wall biosynthesis|nr:glycosyltransferase family 4 protein [Anaerolineae bacterium]MBT4312192.1 glycosyltransferase family 4 protein [Anaerolineae bacterium]MBT4459905.1 glycosyltransferase family 4 protein [Anaerolineae bacterium]MBT4841439.1 glycosyltransferase family 4 protein [Anaerolineae bacterium]MBT6061427.1 glycosyltransferase family 4 protein [Anaerolineae bacterium]
MKILTVLTYYRPHTSGLTIYAERLAKAFVKRGHEVTVMTTQYDPDLPREEMMDGVRVIRVPVAFRVSKGVIAPTFGLVATKLVFEHDVVQLHLPQFDAPGVAFRARLFGKPSVLTYHCDLNLPTGFFNKIVNSVVHFQNNMAGILANRIVTYTQDYADHSPYLSRYQKKLRTFLPPVELPNPGDNAISAFAKEHKISERNPVIGMATRFAAEKGVGILLDAMPQILEKYPNAQVLFAGQYEDVFSEQEYADRLMPRIKEYEKSENWTFLGILNPTEMAAFYPALDALVVPSLNATEAFGLVQIEAMLNNVPCVASALPGVRQPVLMHDMGEVAAIGSSDELADGLLKIFADKEKYRCDTAALAQTYNPDSVAIEYEKMFAELRNK